MQAIGIRVGYHAVAPAKAEAARLTTATKFGLVILVTRGGAAR
jgi:hypothetical protein